MTFHCKNYDIAADRCKKLSGACVPARKGCVLEGRMVVSDDLAERIRQINEETVRRSLKETADGASQGSSPAVVSPNPAKLL